MSRLQNLIDENRNSTGTRLNSLSPSLPEKQSRLQNLQNNGGIKGGLGYLGQKAGLGFLSSVEGIWDYTAGGVAKLLGEAGWEDATRWAERQFLNDWVNYNSADERYNPSEGWKMAGDIAGGIGTSLPAIAGVAIAAGTAIASGGTLTPLASSIISASIAGLGAAGNATKEAFKQSGTLGGKEFAYGALVGGTEAALEGISGKLGVGAGRIYQALAKETAKQTAEALAIKGAKSVLKEMGKDFAQEAFEEGLSEILSPIYQRMTYNPEAQYASPQEVAYAAMIGGLSGMIMSGSAISIGSAVNTTDNYLSGKKATESGTATGIMESGKAITDAEVKNDTGIEAFQSVQDTYTKLVDSLKKTNNIDTNENVLTAVKNGTAKFNAKEMMYLGKLKRANTVAHLEPYIEKSAQGLIFNAENAAQRFSAFGMTDASGKPLNFTAEDILSGVDAELINKAKEGKLTKAESKVFAKSLRNAMSTNSVLTTLAVAEATGEIIMDTRRIAESMLNGEQIANTADINYLIERGSESEKRAVSEAFKIDDLNKASAEEIKAKVAEMAANGQISEYAKQSKRMRQALKLGKDNAKPIPHILKKNMADGVYRYAGDNIDAAILKEGDAYYLYDYEGGNLSRQLSSKEINKILRDYWTSGKTTTARAESDSKVSESTEDIDSWAKDNIADYKSLSEPNKAAVRMTVRQARANGTTDTQTRILATVAAKSGLNVIFDPVLSYGDGSILGNTIYINPNNSESRTYEVILGHEMFHKIFATGSKKAKRLYSQARKFLSREDAAKVKEKYESFYKNQNEKAGKNVFDEEFIESVSEEEIGAAGAEVVFKSKEAWEYIIGEEPTLADKVLSFFRQSARDYTSIQGLSAQARKFVRQYKALFDSISERNKGNNALSFALEGMKYKTPEEAKDSGEVNDARFSLVFSKDIADKQKEYVGRGYSKITDEELQSAIDATSVMVEKMLPHADILPQDKVGKTLVKNGSYDVSVENTTICIRTLAYNSFVDMVSEKVGRPLTQMESFLVSQKLYEIAKEPQCLYCYVSLDRKAFNEMIIRYTEQRDAAIKAYVEAGKPKIPNALDAEWGLFKNFLEGRKPTKNMWNRYVGWLDAYNKGEDFVTLEDIATEAKRVDIVERGGYKASQVKDMLRYAQSASWAKKQTQYVAYYDEILKLKPQVIRNLNSHYGMRWYSFSDYSGAFIVENMQQITDASIRGLKGLSYTKDTDFAEIFAPTGMNINISVYAKKTKDGGYEIDAKQSANIDEAIKLRKKYPNVGIVVVATDQAGVEWALDQEWSDVVIPFHTVRTGADVAEFYNWEIFNAEQSDTVTDQNLWDAYVESVGKKKASKMVYPSEHQNDRDTYLRICKERGLTPRFKSFLDNPNYMKLVNETRQSESQTSPLKAKFNLEAAERSFDKFVEKGGYYEGWYNDGIDVDGEAEIVAQDVKAGKKANEVSYGRQDIDAEGIQRGRKSNREHGRRFALNENGTSKISAEMSDAERAEILSKKRVAVPIYTGQVDATILANKDAFEQKKMDIVKTVIETLGDEFGLVGGQINFEDVDIEVTLSKTNLRESTTKQATPAQLAKLIPVLKPAAQTAVGIERHDNRYFFDNDTVYFDNLLGGYIDGEDFVPVRFGLKHSRTGNTVLYVVVDQNKIPVSNLMEIKNDTGHQDAKSDLTEVGSPRRRVTYSIAQIIQFVNSRDALRYLPDEMLSAEQRVTKWKAVAETAKYTAKKNDKKYFEYIKNGNLRDARRMIIAAAKAAGYTIEGYHGTRQTFTAFSNESKGSNTRTETSKRMFFAADKATANSYYPYGVMQAIHEQHPEWAWADPEKVKVKGNLYHLFIRMSNPLTVDVADYDYASHRDNADSWMEFVAQTEANHNDGIILLNAMDNQLDTSARSSTVYMFAQPSQAKSAETITYDDEGNIIPISKRFDVANPDMRFALTDDALFAEKFGNANEADGRRYALSETRESIMTEVDPEYKPTVQDKVFSGWTAAQIAFTNAQAGIETVGRKYGVKNIESLVQAARSGRNQAEEMIAGNQYRIGADAKTYQGEGLEAIFRPISRQGEEVKGDFFDYLFNYHNMSRMTLEQRSMAEQQNRLDDLKKKVSALENLNKRIEKLQEQIKALGMSKKDMETKRGLREELAMAKAEAKTLKKEATKLEKAAKAFVPLENKPVLGTTDEHGIETVVTAEQSEAIVKKYEEAHPEFKGVAEKVWAFLKNLNQYRVDTGLISQDTFDYLAKLYPHYVPTYRTGATKGIGAIEGKYNLKVKNTIKTAKGSTKNLLPPDVIIARQVMETVRAGRINQLANALYEGAQKSGDTTYIEIVSKERMSDEAIAELDPTELRPKNNEVVFFRDGERITMRVSKEIFAGFNAFNPEVENHNPLVNGARAINNGFKRLVTSLNPAFLLRNTIRDVQDAGINTRYGKTFLKNYARASYEISHNGKLWRLYKAMGGFSSSVFDFEKGFSGMQNKWGLTKAEGNLLQKTLQGVENANAFVEQLPRLAEFISSIEAGNTAEQAILDSADVTTNFARMGNITKVLNRTLIPFLNPSIQGCSKMIRNITSIRSAREFASLALKAALVGVVPMVLNMLMYEDDEDYKNLRDSDKENNFLFKVGDTFVKIPRGRVASVIGGLVNRSKTSIEGEDADWAGYVKNIMQQVTPVDSMSRTIFSPFADVANNITWYGSAIEGRQFENTAPKDRYDESTSSIAIAIGNVINYSPKKIHYLLDQYSGVIGDFILPATTAKAEKDFLSGNFTLDPATSNKLSTEFYELYDEAQYAKTAGDKTAAYQVRYLNKVKSAISEMYKQKSEIQNNTELTNGEKLQQARVVQILINEAYKTALQDFELYTKAIEATAGMEDENLRFTEATRLMYGAERALAEYNSEVYAKCQMLNKAGVDFETLYNYYFSLREMTSDKDNKGNTVNGSKREKVVSHIKGMKITTEQKLMLICAAGYSIKDGDIRGMSAQTAKNRLLQYILKLRSINKEQKAELAQICGFEVKNGKIMQNAASK